MQNTAAGEHLRSTAVFLAFSTQQTASETLHHVSHGE